MKELMKVSAIEIKIFLREKIAVFFTFLFPLFILFLFGSIWGKNPKYFGYLIPMLIAMVIFSNALYGIGLTLAYYKESGIFKRIGITPLKPRTYIYGLILVRVLIILIQSFFLLALGIVLYRLKIEGNFWVLVLSILIGIFSMLSIGGIVATISKNHETALAISNFTLTPILFLSGAFIPLFLFPKVLQHIAKVSPVYHFIKILQDIIILGKGLKDEWISFSVLIFCLLFCFLITANTFKFQEQ